MVCFDCTSVLEKITSTMIVWWSDKHQKLLASGYCHMLSELS